MAAVEISPDDLAPFAVIDDAKAEEMIADALALAKQYAPCIADSTLDDDKAAAAKAVIRQVILRWHDSGTGAVSTQVAGPFQLQIDTRQQRRNLFSPAELDQLERLCRASGMAGAYEVDLTPAGAGLIDESQAWTVWPWTQGPWQ